MSAPPPSASQQKTISDQAQTFWLQWVEAAFPDLDSRAYFLPPVYVNRVPMTRQQVAGQDVLVLQPATGQAGQSNQPTGTSSAAQAPMTSPTRVQNSDVRDDAAMQRLFFCLQTMFEENKEILFGLCQLQFGHYLGEPCYAAAAAQLPRSCNFPPTLPRNWKQGDFDLLLIHRQYGLIVCEVKAFGDNIHQLNMSQHDVNNNIRKKLKDAVSQLDKAEAMLSHLVSDVTSGLRITKTIAFPNLTSHQVQQAVSGDTRLTQDLCRCLGTTDPADITGLCLCCDQLSDPKTPCDVSSHVLRELGHWWQRRVAGAGPDSHMTPDLYKTLTARFCGPATTVTVPCTSTPRLSVKTLDQAVSLTGDCYTCQLTLFPEQVHLLNTAPPRVFVVGPPGTGKSVVLLLMGIQWLLGGHNVYIVSTWRGSEAACYMLYHLLLQIVNKHQTTGVPIGRPYFLKYNLNVPCDTEVDKALNDLTQAASEGSLYIITDEAGSTYSDDFETLCKKLEEQVPRLHLWGASFYHGHSPDGWQMESFTRPLRCPPTVVREVEQDKDISKEGRIDKYSERGVPHHTDGPPVKQVHHIIEDHRGFSVCDCATCGREVSSFLHSLRGVPKNLTTTSTTSVSGGSTQGCLQWRDMLVMTWFIPQNSPMLAAMREAGIPVRIIENDEDIKDVATASSDVVWVMTDDRARGLERKVVVFVQWEPDYGRLHYMSRCTSQLVIVSNESRKYTGQSHDD